MDFSDNLRKDFIRNLIVLTFIVLVDQLSKRVLFNDIGLNNTKEFLPGLINFTVVLNTGGAFSVFKEYPVYFKAIGIINLLIFSYLAFCPTVYFNKITKTGCLFILGGTIGNLTDRFITGGVIDFLDLQFINFAIFNLADVFIDIGVILILIGWFCCRGNS